MAVGEEWGKTAEGGLVIGLSGDLGAGKTQLVKGVARGLGVTAQVHSPTFTLVNVYAGGRLNLFHLDLYRLETLEQISNAGLEEYLQPAGVAVIEWAERWFGTGGHRPPVDGPVEPGPPAALPKSRWPQRFRLAHIELLSETYRRITYEDPGA
jgi:tRNA threonylcarbamoyladenosine biosynthesis protein TsaE